MAEAAMKKSYVDEYVTAEEERYFDVLAKQAIKEIDARRARGESEYIDGEEVLKRMRAKYGYTV